MPAKIDPTTLTLRDAEIFKYHMLDKKTLDETADLVGVSRDVVKRTKKKQAFCELIDMAMQDEGYAAKEYAENLISMLQATKGVNYAGRRQEEPDNLVRMQALRTWGDVTGAYAPKQLNLQHQMGAISDDELEDELKSSLDMHNVESRVVSAESVGKKPELINVVDGPESGPDGDIPAVKEDEEPTETAGPSDEIAGVAVNGGQSEDGGGNPAQV